MYKSPIELIMGQIETQTENYICKAIRNVGVNVDKDELLKALQYDRNQYQKGYNDRDAEIVRCKDCKWNNGYTGCDKYLLPHGGDWFCADGERRTD